MQAMPAQGDKRREVQEGRVYTRVISHGHVCVVFLPDICNHDGSILHIDALYKELYLYSTSLLFLWLLSTARRGGDCIMQGKCDLKVEARAGQGLQQIQAINR
jgi:hypothetical protein